MSTDALLDEVRARRTFAIISHPDAGKTTNTENMPLLRCQTPLLIGAVFLFSIIIIEFVAILILNNGILVYTLDDAYIHMALAENIHNWHYGVNATEFSAASSSILWPLIIALFPSFEYFPLLINIFFSTIIFYIFYQIVDRSFIINHPRIRVVITTLVLLLFIGATNIVGLIFLGMEHSLQILLVTIIAYGLMQLVEENKLQWWLIFSIIVAPLVRYDCLAVSCAAIAYLCMQRFFKPAIIAMFFIVLTLGSFSLFLWHLDLGLLPTSILAKSAVINTAGQFQSILANVKESFTHWEGLRLIGIAIALIIYFFNQKNRHQYQLAGITILAILLHLIVGQYGWYNRYDVYIWTFSLLMGTYFIGRYISLFPEWYYQPKHLIKSSFVAFLVFFSSAHYFSGLLKLPIAANNIYEQQYQMHRFVVDYYQKPVAVNDLGWTAYKNSGYVLDLWGLASLTALKHRKNHDDKEWMNILTQSKNVQMAILYDEWFSILPKNWIKVAVMHLSKTRVTPASDKVVFYALNNNARQEVLIKLHDFQKTLPTGVVMDFTQVVVD